MSFNDIINDNFEINNEVCKDNKPTNITNINNGCGFGKDKQNKKVQKEGHKEGNKEGHKEDDKKVQTPEIKPNKKTSQMKIPVSTSVITNTKQIVSENPEDKVNIVIKSCKNISSKQALLIIPITKFFSNREMLNKIITILKGESISLRLIDWFVTNYCKKFNVLYNLNDFKGEQTSKTTEELQSFDNYIIVHNNYKGQLKAYSKRNFDPFCRRNRIRFYYEDNKYFITTVGQLNFFKWALENHIIDYINRHLKAIDTDMNLRCETVKVNGTKINPCNAQNSQSSQNAQNQQNSQNSQNAHILDDTGLPLPMQMPVIVSTKKKKPQDGIIAVETQIKTQLKNKPGGSTRKKRKEISTAASKSLSIHNFPTTLVFD